MTSYTQRMLGCLVVVLSLEAFAGAAWAEPKAETNITKIQVASGDAAVSVQRFDPAEPGRHPAVVILAGMGSPESYQGMFQQIGKQYAARGYAVFIVNYFQRTGTKTEELEEVYEGMKNCLQDKDGAVESKARELFLAWTGAVKDVVSHVRGQANVDPDRIGLVGFSLGAYLALTVASEEEQRIAAVVEFFGGMPAPLHDKVKSLPPVLGFHGDKDKVVPLAEARALEQLARTKKLTVEMHIEAGVGHVFQSETGDFQAFAAYRAAQTTQTFLDKHLRPAETKRTKPGK